MPLVLETKRCRPAKKVRCGTSTLPLFSDFFLKALQSSSRRFCLKSLQLSGLPIYNFFHSEKRKWIFSFDSPQLEGERKDGHGARHKINLAFPASCRHSLPCKKFLPLTSYQTCKCHELRATRRSFFPASLTFIYRSLKGLETVLDASPKQAGRQGHRRVPGRDPNHLLGWGYFLKSSFGRPRWIPPHTYRDTKRSQTAGLRLLLLPRWF